MLLGLVGNMLNYLTSIPDLSGQGDIVTNGPEMAGDSSAPAFGRTGVQIVHEQPLPGILDEVATTPAYRYTRHGNTGEHPCSLRSAEIAVLLASCGMKVIRARADMNPANRPKGAGPTWIFVGGCDVELDESASVPDDEYYSLDYRHLVRDAEELRRWLIYYQYDGLQDRADQLCRIAWRAIMAHLAEALAVRVQVEDSLGDLESDGFHHSSWWKARELARVVDPGGDHFYGLLRALWGRMQTPEHRRSVVTFAEKLTKFKSPKGILLEESLPKTLLTWQVPPCGAIPKRVPPMEGEQAATIV